MTEFSDQFVPANRRQEHENVHRFFKRRWLELYWAPELPELAYKMGFPHEMLLGSDSRWELHVSREVVVAFVIGCEVTAEFALEEWHENPALGSGWGGWVSELKHEVVKGSEARRQLHQQEALARTATDRLKEEHKKELAKLRRELKEEQAAHGRTLRKLAEHTCLKEDK